jgi:hypothetical protein
MLATVSAGAFWFHPRPVVGKAWTPLPRRHCASVGIDEAGPRMRAALSTPLTRYNQSRERIFTALLADRTRPWSVAELAENVPEVSADAARSTLYLLLADRLVHESPRHRRMTFHLTAEGAEVLRHVLRRWRAARPDPHETTGQVPVGRARTAATGPRPVEERPSGWRPVWALGWKVLQGPEPGNVTETVAVRQSRPGLGW